MSALPLLIGFSFIIAAGFLVAFLWSVYQGQYDDDFTPSVSILFDEEQPEKNDKEKIFQTTHTNSN